MTLIIREIVVLKKRTIGKLLYFCYESSLIKESTVYDFIHKNKASHASFEVWLNKLRLADGNMPSDIINLYAGVDLLGSGSNRVIFDIGGNDFRMICKYAFCKSEVRLYICWIGIHAEYDKICSFNMQCTVSY